VLFRSLQDRNESGSRLQYRVGGGAWLPYAGTFTVTRDSYPTGLSVEGRAQATCRAYLDSAVANAAIGVTTAKLKPPEISPSAPNFMAGSVESITVTINNPNTTGSTLEYRINGGSWQTYRNSFAVTRSSYPAGLPIDARARATTTAYTDSDSANTRLGLTQVQLLAPSVTSTAPNFVAGSVESIWMTLTNPNATGSTLEYRLNGSSWRAYTGSFKVTRSTYATGVLVEGRARATSTAYLDSPNGSRSIGLTPVQLAAPSIRKTSPYFAAGVVETIGITILNPNSTGSTLQYRINGGSWINYSGGFNVARSAYPSGLTIEARARATSVAYLDSPTASTTITVNSGPVQKVTLTFSSLASSAGYLNEAFIAVNGDSYYLGNSDIGAGTTVNVDIFVNPTVTNVFDLTIDTYKRSGSTFTSGALRGMDTRNGSQFTVIPAAASFAGPASNAGKIKDQSTASRIQMVVGYEDLIITGETPDYDYNDFQFEVKAPQAVNLIFGGYRRGM